MEGVEGPVVETLKKEKEAEDCRNAKRWRKEPTGLTQRIHQKYADEYSDRTRECDCVVRTDTYKASNLKLTKHESNQSERSVERHKRPESPKLAPPDEIPLRLRTPK
jgi:hypothetical protein